MKANNDGVESPDSAIDSNPSSAVDGQNAANLESAAFESESGDKFLTNFF